MFITLQKARSSKNEKWKMKKRFKEGNKEYTVITYFDKHGYNSNFVQTNSI